MCTRVVYVRGNVGDSDSERETQVSPAFLPVPRVYLVRSENHGLDRRVTLRLEPVRGRVGAVPLYPDRRCL